jgi:hypothetical protein
MKAELQNLILKNEGDVIPYYSRHDFSMHQLIECLILQTGPADVILSSFSICEEAVRTMFNLSETGQIKSLTCLFDFMVKKHKLALLFFSNSFTSNISIAKCHAKITLIKSADYTLSVVSSANLNVNDKIEAGVIFKDKRIYDFYNQKLSEDIENGIKIFKDDVEF